MTRMLRTLFLIVALTIPVSAGEIPTVPGCTENCPNMTIEEGEPGLGLLNELEDAVLDILLLFLVR